MRRSRLRSRLRSGDGAVDQLASCSGPEDVIDDVRGVDIKVTSIEFRRLVDVTVSKNDVGEIDLWRKRGMRSRGAMHTSVVLQVFDTQPDGDVMTSSGSRLLSSCKPKV